MKTEDILARVRYDLPETGKIVGGLSGGAEGYAAKPNFPALELTVTDTAGITRI